MPAKTQRAARNDLKLSIGLVTRLTAPQSTFRPTRIGYCDGTAADGVWTTWRAPACFIAVRMHAGALARVEGMENAARCRGTFIRVE